MIYKKIYF